MTIHQLHPTRNTLQANGRDLTIKIVDSEDERLKAMLVRAIVYMHEQQCPYSEEFDLNDHTATQIIGLDANNEPVLTARVRYFNNFAKIERLAIRKEYRSLGYGHRLLTYILHLCRQKGYSRFYLHAQARLQPFYESYGFRVVGDDFAFSDHDYLEMLLEEKSPLLQPFAQISVNPMALNRPEGNLHVAGPLEKRATFEREQHMSYAGEMA